MLQIHSKCIDIFNVCFAMSIIAWIWLHAILSYMYAHCKGLSKCTVLSCILKIPISVSQTHLLCTSTALELLYSFSILVYNTNPMIWKMFNIFRVVNKIWYCSVKKMAGVQKRSFVLLGSKQWSAGIQLLFESSDNWKVSYKILTLNLSLQRSCHSVISGADTSVPWDMPVICDAVTAFQKNIWGRNYRWV